MIAALSVNLTVSNPTDMQRQELVAVDMNQIGVKAETPFVVVNGKGQEVDYQVSYDGKLLIDACVTPHGTTTFTVKEGVPREMKTWVKGAMYPLRKDDVAWENDRGAYRIYGPALQRTGEKAYGIDVWTKNTPELVVADRFYKDYQANIEEDMLRRQGKKEEARQLDILSSFHYDQGNGLDCYGVGPSLGCGAPALMVGGQLQMPWCYQTYQILDNGPLRFTVELTYAHGEHRIISLDKGSNFNRITVWYDSIPARADLAAGVVIHQADTKSVVTGKDFVAYADPTDQPRHHGYQLYVAALFPEGAETQTLMLKQPQGEIAGHALGIVRKATVGRRYTYYAGSAWSCYDVRTFREWQLRIEEFLEAVKSPLTITLSTPQP